MKIVVLDGYTTNPGDLSWDKFEELGDLTVCDRTSPDEIVERAKDADIILTNKVGLNRETISRLPNLNYIGILATGFNIIDLEAARERGIVVTNIPAYSTHSVAQMVFALLLAVTNRIEYLTGENRRGRWSFSADFCYLDFPLTELAEKTFGIVGLGNIGHAVAKIANAFEMKVLAYTSKSRDELPEYIEKAASLEDLLRRSDVVSLHCPLTDKTTGMINSETLSKMKPTAILINTARGMLINEADLAEALKEGKIAAAAMDVMASEPPKADNPLLSAPNCFTSPHIAWATFEARQRLMDVAVDNLRSYLDGHPRNVVD